MTATVLAETTRSGRVECRHHGSLAVCDASGKLLRGVGAIDLPFYLRSAAKPFQALAVLRSGAAERFGWGDDEIALACASHAAEPVHRELAARMLAGAGCAESHLLCGTHPPLGKAARDELVRADREPTPLWHNCSGKHAAMLSACTASGWAHADYTAADHPLQRANIATWAAFTGTDPTDVRFGTDGCGVPTFFTTAREAAAAWARLCASGDPHTLRVRHAMTGRPELIGGSELFNTRLQRFTGPAVWSKNGAEGVYCLAIPEQGIGMALKIDDGAARAVAPVVLTLLAEYLPELRWDEFGKVFNPPLTTARGVPVGVVRPAF